MNLHKLQDQTTRNHYFSNKIKYLKIDQKPEKQSCCEQMESVQNLNPPRRNHPWKYWIYFVTACGAACFSGLIGSYSMIKKPMSEDLGLQEGFLGLLDGMDFLGLTLGFIFLLVKPIKFPKRDFLISCIISAILLSLIPLATYLINFSQPILILSHFGAGFLRSYLVIPYIFVIQYFDAAVQNRIAINFWNSIGNMGDVIGVLSISFMLNKLQINWKIAFFINLAMFLIFSVLQYVSVEQIDMDEHNRKNGDPTDNTWQENKQFIQVFFGKMQNLLWAIDFAFVSSLYYSILLWFPYYFQKLGYHDQSSIISIMYPIFTTLGVLVYQYPILLCPSKGYLVIFAMFGINVIVFIIMTQLGQGQSDIYRYMILVAVSGLVKGGPYPTITSSQMRLRAKTNRQIYFALTSGKMAMMLLTVFLMVIIGFFMQNNLKSFIYILTISTSFNTVLHIFRNLYYGPPGQSKQTMLITDHPDQPKKQSYSTIQQSNKNNQIFNE